MPNGASTSDGLSYELGRQAGITAAIEARQAERTNELLSEIAETVVEIRDRISTPIPQKTPVVSFPNLDRGEIIRVVITALALLGSVALVMGRLTPQQAVELIKGLKGSVP